MGKLNKNSRINANFVQDYVSELVTLFDQAVKESSDVVFKSGNITENLIVNGDLLVKGNSTVLETQTLQVDDNIITINNNDIGSGVSRGYAGIEIKRGDLPSYMLVFSEDDNQTFRIGQEGYTKAIMTRDDSINEGIFVWDDSQQAMKSTKNITSDIYFNGTNSTSVSSGSIKTNGIGLLGDMFVQGTLNIENSAGKLSIGKNIDDFEITTSKKLTLNTISTFIPETSSIVFGTDTTYIKYNGFEDSLDINSSETININTPQTVFSSTDNTDDPDTGAILVEGSVGIYGKLNINADLQDYSLFGENSELIIKNNSQTSDLNLILQPFSNLGDVDNKIKIKTLESELSIGYDSFEDSYIINNSKTKTININNSQLEFRTNGSLYSNNNVEIEGTFITKNVTNSSSTEGSIKTSGGISIEKDVYVGGSQIIKGTAASTGLSTGCLQLDGGLSSSKDSYFDKKLILNNFVLDPQNNLILTHPTDSKLVIKPSVSDTNSGIKIEPSALVYLDINYMSINDEFNIYSSKSISLGRNKQLELKQDGTVFLDNSSSSSSLDSAALVINGGVSIKNTTLATDKTNGGALTVAGGASIGGNLLVEGSSIYADNVEINGTLKVDDKTTLNDYLILSMSGQDYTWKPRTILDNEILFSSSGEFKNGLLSSLSNGTQSVLTNWYSSGGLNTTEYSKLSIGYNQEKYIISSDTGATGVLYDISIYTKNYPDQLKIQNTGQIVISPNIVSTSTDGALIVNGGITSTNSTDSSGLNNGGSLTLMGGASINKKLNLGTDLTLNSQTGVLTVAGNTIPRFLVNSSSTTISANGTNESISITNSETNIENIVKINNVENTTGINSGSLRVSGGVYVNKDLFVNKNLHLNSSSQTYIFKESDTSSLVLQSESDNNLIFKSLSNNYLFDIKTTIESGYETEIKYSKLNLGWDSSRSKYIMNVDAEGFSNHDLVFENNIQEGQMVLKPDGTIVLNNTLASTSSTESSLKLAGGLSINKSTDAISTTNGGSITTSGGMSVAKKVFIGGITNIVDQTDSTSYNNGALVVNGGIGGKNISIGSESSDSYNIKSIDNSLVLSGTSSLNPGIFQLQSSSSSVALNITGLTGENNENLSVSWDGTKYNINTNKQGTGSIRNLDITSGSSNILLNPNGQIKLNSTVQSTSSNSASLVLEGGLSINNSTNSSSISNGGSMTLSGGIAISKDVYVGGNTYQISQAPRNAIKQTVSVNTITKNNSGFEITGIEMNTNNYTPLIKFMSEASDFSNSKLLASIGGKSTEEYSSASTGMGIEFRTTPNNIGADSSPTLRVFIDQNGKSFFYNTQNSTNTEGSVNMQGGLTIFNSTNSNSLINGGSLTVLGGASITKDIYIGGKVIVSDTTDISVLNDLGTPSGSLQITGGLFVGKKTYFTDDIFIGCATQDYIFSSKSVKDNSISLKSNSSGTEYSLNLYTFDQDNTDNINLRMYSYGGDNILNFERLDLSYSVLDNNYRIRTQRGGEGLARKLILETSSNTDQISLNTDGTVSFSSTTPSTDFENASLKIKGGLSIAGEALATSELVGGGLTVAGGVAISSNMFVGGQVKIVNDDNSTSSTTGALVVSGGLGIAKDIQGKGKICSNYTGSDALKIANDENVSVLSLNTSTLSLLTSSSISITNETNAVSTVTGSITTTGGVSIAKDLVIGSSMHMAGTSSTLDLNNNYITYLPDPIEFHHAVNKKYVDNKSVGFVAKAPVTLATVSDMPLATSFEAGQIVDGVVLQLNDRILLKDQENGVENGIYVVQAIGAPVRAGDFESGDSEGGSVLFITFGDVNSNTGWQCSNKSPGDIVGTSELTFQKFASSGLNPGKGLVRVGDLVDIDVDVDPNSIEIFNNKLRVSSGVAGTGLTGGGGVVLSTSSNQSHVSTIGTIESGTWNAGVIDVAYGGTGVNNISSGLITFGNGTNPVSTDSVFKWDNTKKSLGLNTSTPDPSTEGDGLTLSAKDLSIRSSNSSETRGIYFQNNDNKYTWNITRKTDTLSYPSLLFKSSGISGTANKTNINTNVPALTLRSDNRIGINTEEGSITSALYVTGSAVITSGLSCNEFSGGRVSHTLTLSADTNMNIVLPVAISSNLFRNNTYCRLTFMIKVQADYESLNTVFTILLPQRENNFTNEWDVTGTLSGWSSPNKTVLQNILLTSVPGTKNISCKFQSSSALTDTYLQGVVYYDIN